MAVTRSLVAFLAVTFCLCTVEATWPYKYALPGMKRWPRDSDWTSLRATVSGDVFVRGEAGYDLDDLYSLKVFINHRSNLPQPAAITFPKTIDDVQKLVKFAKKHVMRVAVFNTGHNHDLRSTADNTLLINMRNFKSVTVDLDTPSATVGGGCVFADVVEATLAASGNTLIPLSGTSSTVGVWGWSTGGGTGMLSGLYGLGADAILAATVVTGDGHVVTATTTNKHKNLLWALKGAGPSFAVGVSLTLKLVPRPQVVSSYMGVYAITDELATAYINVAKAKPNNAWHYYFVFQPGYVSILSFCADSGCDEHMAFARAIPGCISAPGTIRCVPFQLTNFPVGFTNMFVTDIPKGNYEYVVGGVTAATYEAAIHDVNDWLAKPEAVSVSKQCYGEAMLGGAAATSDPTGELTSIAPGFRQAVGYFECAIFWSDDLSVADQKAAIAILHDFENNKLRTHSPNEWVYWNDAPHKVQGNWQARYWGSDATYAKLLAVKQKYDKHSVVTCHHCVGWDFDENVDPAICPQNNCSCSNNAGGTCASY